VTNQIGTAVPLRVAKAGCMEGSRGEARPLTRRPMAAKPGGAGG
jgi:hypothetical protein